jgi:hypothetical protein
MLVLFSFVLAHSAFPHHHHIDTSVTEHRHNHDEEHHHHDRDDDHNVFTFSQIDDIFLTGKQLVIPIIIVYVPTASFTLIVSEEDVVVEYVERDIHRPPLISIPQHTFRGPPTLS